MLVDIKAQHPRVMLSRSARSVSAGSIRTNKIIRMTSQIESCIAEPTQIGRQIAVGSASTQTRRQTRLFHSFDFVYSFCPPQRSLVEDTGSRCSANGSRSREMRQRAVPQQPIVCPSPHGISTFTTVSRSHKLQVGFSRSSSFTKTQKNEESASFKCFTWSMLVPR